MKQVAENKEVSVLKSGVVVETKLAVKPAAPKPMTSILTAMQATSNGHAAKADVVNMKPFSKTKLGKEAKKAFKSTKLTGMTGAQVTAALKPVAPKAVPAKAVKHVDADDYTENEIKEAVAAKPVVKTVTPDVAVPINDVTQAIRSAKFTHSQSHLIGGRVAHGFQHVDGRAVLYSYAPKGKDAKWQLLHPDGSKREGTTLAALKSALTIKATKSVMNKAARRVADQKDHAERLVANEARTKALATTTPAVVQDIAHNVLRAAEMLGGATKQQFNFEPLKGTKQANVRVSILRKLLNDASVTIKEATVDAITKAFHTAIGTVKADEFTKRCRSITAAARSMKSAATRLQSKAIATQQRASVSERTVPGDIIPAPVRLSRKDRAAKDTQDAQDVLHENLVLVATTAPIARPKPEAEVKVVAGDVRLLEDPVNGIVMLQVERANSQGAICVYNNGSRVAAGVVPPEILKTLRAVSNADVAKAASQLLTPVVPSVPVTTVATRHLTAVLHCKELTMTATATVTPIINKKFAAPAKTAAKKSAAPAKKAAGKQDVKAPHAPRVSNFDYNVKVVATKTAAEAKEGTFPGMLGKYAAKPIIMQTLINTLAKNAELRSAQDPTVVFTVRVRDAFNKGELLKAAK